MQDYDQILLNSSEIKDKNEIVMVPEYVYKCVYKAYASNPEIIKKLNVTSFESLKGTNYKVECRSGYVWINTNLGKVVSPGNLSDVRTSEQGLTKLLKGRTDIFVSVQEDIETLLASEEFKGKITCIGTVGSVVAGGWMSKKFTDTKYKPFLLELADSIKKMKESGEIAAILKKEGM